MATTPTVPASTRPRPVSSLVKSRDRVKDLAEVYTPGHVVDQMLDLLARQSLATSGVDVTRDPKSRFLEPACGNGNFLEAILARKLAVVAERRSRQTQFEYQTLLAVTSVYGIDIDSQNVDEARERLRNTVRSHYSNSRRGAAWTHSPGFDESLDHVLRSNIVLGDSLNGADEIVLVEYSVSKPERKYPQHFDQTFYTLTALLQTHGGQGTLSFPPAALRRLGPTHFLAIAAAPPNADEVPS